jgi:cyclophilin family peptidyl-prolyl cis-trans isomerase
MMPHIVSEILLSPPLITSISHMDRGDFKAEILLDTMPITASNFIDLVRNGFYDGIHFHRVM